MIKSFGDRDTEDFFHGIPKAARKLGTVANVAARKLDMLNAAHTLDDLRVPPANRLEALKAR